MSARLQAARETFAGLQSQRDALRRQIERREEELEAERREVELLGQVKSLLQLLVTQNQERVKRVLETIVTRGLRAVMEEDIRFKVLVQEDGRSGVSFRFVLDTGPGSEERPIMKSEAGGLWALISVLLRVSVLLMVKPPLRRVLLLDEGLLELSGGYRDAAATMLSRLCSDLGIDILLVTHAPEMAASADHVYHLERKDGEVRIRESDLTARDGMQRQEAAQNS